MPAVSCPGVSSERGVALRQVRPSDVLATRGLPDGPCGFPVRRLPLLPPTSPLSLTNFLKFVFLPLSEAVCPSSIFLGVILALRLLQRSQAKRRGRRGRRAPCRASGGSGPVRRGTEQERPDAGQGGGGSVSRAAEPARPPRSGSEASDDSGARCGRGGRRPAPVALGRVSPAWAGPGRAEGSDVPPASPVGAGPAGAGRSVRAPWAGARPGCESCLHEVLGAQVRLRCWAPRWAWPASGGGAGWKGPDANCPDQLRGWATVPKSRRRRPPGAGRPVPYGSLNQGPRRDRAHCASTPRQPVR